MYILNFSIKFLRKWILDAYDYWDNIRKSIDAPLAGVCQLSAYIFSKNQESITRVSKKAYKLYNF